MRDHGPPGSPEPTFRTRDRRYLSLDNLVHEVVDRLEADGLRVSHEVARGAIKTARALVAPGDGRIRADELAWRVSQDLRHRRVILHPDLVGEILSAYVRVVVDAEITEVMDFV